MIKHIDLCVQVQMLHIIQFFRNNVELQLLEHLSSCELIYQKKKIEFFYFSLLNSRATGIGAVQVNMAVFGADQFRETKMASRYFDKYYVAVNIGATIATLSISMIQSDSNRRENPNSYFYGYLIGFLMIIGANILFIVGYRYYLHINPYDSILLKFIPVVINAFRTRRRNRRNTQISYRARENSQINQTTISQDETIDSEQSMSFLDYADIANNGKFTHRVVDDAKTFQRAIIVYLLLIPYWITYYQV